MYGQTNLVLNETNGWEAHCCLLEWKGCCRIGLNPQFAVGLCLRTLQTPVCMCTLLTFHIWLLLKLASGHMNFAIYVNHMLPHWLCQLSALLCPPMAIFWFVIWEATLSTSFGPFNLPITTCNWLHKGRGSPTEFIVTWHVYTWMTCICLMLSSQYRASGIGVAGTAIAVLLFGRENNTNILLRQLRQLIDINHPRLTYSNSLCTYRSQLCWQHFLPENSLDRWKKNGLRLYERT